MKSQEQLWGVGWLFEGEPLLQKDMIEDRLVMLHNKLHHDGVSLLPHILLLVIPICYLYVQQHKCCKYIKRYLDNILATKWQSDA